MFGKPAPDYRVLMVCLGNICRSPTAEAVLRHQLRAAGLGDRVEVDSAGTGGWHAGEPPDPRAQKHAAQRGYDLSKLRARQVRAEDFERFDLVLGMDRGNLERLQALAPAGSRAEIGLLMAAGTADAGAEEVPDPYYGPPAGFEHVLDLVEKACAGWVKTLQIRVR